MGLTNNCFLKKQCLVYWIQYAFPLQQNRYKQHKLQYYNTKFNAPGQCTWLYSVQFVQFFCIKRHTCPTIGFIHSAQWPLGTVVIPCLLMSVLSVPSMDSKFPPSCCSCCWSPPAWTDEAVAPVPCCNCHNTILLYFFLKNNTSD